MSQLYPISTERLTISRLDARKRRRTRLDQQEEEIDKLKLEKEELLRNREILASNSLENTAFNSGLPELDQLSKQNPQDVPSGLAKYMKQSLNVQSLTAYVRTLSTLIDNLDNPSLELESLCWKVEYRLKVDTNKLVACRRELWNSGYDLDGIDQLMHNQPSDIWKEAPDWISSNICPSSEGQQMPWWNVLHHTISKRWVTKKDRINSWLLQNLATLPGEPNRHRALLPNSDGLSEEQWARVVLKFWPLDEAAPKFEHSSCSTNGAVDSAGACHSVKVLLSALPFHEDEDQVMVDTLPIWTGWEMDSEDDWGSWK